MVWTHTCSRLRQNPCCSHGEKDYSPIALKKTQHVVSELLALAMLFASSGARAQLASGSMDVRCDEGASKCATNSQSPLQVHSYNDRTFILRENLCVTFEAPFLYLLIGSEKALLTDT